MKKFIFLIFACLTVVCTKVNAQEEVKFKNPIFYNRMVPDNGGPDLIMTPTTIKEDMREDGIAEGTCKLLANEENYIINICTVYYQSPSAVRVYKNKYELLYDCAKMENTVYNALDRDEDCIVKEYDYDGTSDRIAGWSFYEVKKTR